MSERQVQLRLSAADTVREKAPTVWGAFRDGAVDLSRVRDIASTIDKLHREESIFRLDRLVVAYAAEHTAAELRQWLRRFVQRVEADLAVERADDERTKRHVSIKHTDDSMSWLSAYLPSHEAAAIEARLRKEARKPVTDGDADDRTVAQREADLLVAWCIDSDAAASAIDANIAVTIDADVLAGAVAGFAPWITNIANNTASHPRASEASQAAWCERQRATGMSSEAGAAPTYHEYLGRFAPDVLDIALQYLHEVCQAPGCMVPARWCDDDHRVPRPQGPTSAANMGPFCRRHHIVKGHGILRWSIGPPTAPPPIVVEIYPQPVSIEYAA